ncbi:hypothetical protein BASA50_000900 [Batrachochytrium salamandrivorans]|uniref:CAP-Gly domain-containing protein n=1 Tax=Batrachochytrium salamandrivorans TaxID=1357716 RepID=A0ABQ8EV88_9FUNG|nr:hypothetical protein BASA50_000900 [Batrachochytrium salamandrivorans]KAH9265471.1 hypothetical protein BASA84_001609 [Batrachochytrium salamandrivorans]
MPVATLEIAHELPRQALSFDDTEPLHNQEHVFSVGDHVCAASSEASRTYVGKIAFIGETQFSEGPWAGIELFEQGSGMNNGTFQDVAYFSCADNTGVFVPAYKLQVYNPPDPVMDPTNCIASIVAAAEGEEPETADILVATETPIVAQETSTVTEATDGAILDEPALVNVSVDESTPPPKEEAPSSMETTSKPGVVKKPNAKSAVSKVAAGKATTKVIGASSKTTNGTTNGTAKAASSAALLRSPASTSRPSSAMSRPAVSPKVGAMVSSKPSSTSPATAAKKSALVAGKKPVGVTTAIKSPVASVAKRSVTSTIPPKEASTATKPTRAISDPSSVSTSDKKPVVAAAKRPVAPAAKKPVVPERKSATAATERKPINAAVAARSSDTKSATAVSLVASQHRKSLVSPISSMAKTAKPGRPTISGNTDHPIKKVSPSKATPSESLTATSSEIATLRDRIASLELENEALVQKIGQVQTSYMKAMGQGSGADDMEMLKSEFNRVTELNSTLQDRINLMTSEIETLKAAALQTPEHSNPKSIDLDEMEERCMAATSKASAATMAMLELQNTLTSVENERNSSREALESAVAEKTTLLSKLDQLTAEHDLKSADAVTASQAAQSAQSALEEERHQFSEKHAAYEAALIDLKKQHQCRLEEQAEQHASRSAEPDSQMVQDIESLKKELLLKSNVADSLVQEIQQSALQLSELSSVRDSLVVELASRDTAAGEMQATITSLKAELDSVSDHRDCARSIAMNESSAQAAEQRSLELKDALALMQAEQQNSQELNHSLTTQLAAEQESLQSFALKYSAANDQIVSLQETVDELSSASDALMNTLKQKETTIEQLQLSIESLKQQPDLAQVHAAEMEEQRISFEDLSSKFIDAKRLLAEKEYAHSTSDANESHLEKLALLQAALSSKDLAYVDLEAKVESLTNQLSLVAEANQASDALHMNNNAELVLALSTSKELSAELELRLSEMKQHIATVSQQLTETEEFLKEARQENGSLQIALADAKISSPAPQSSISQEDLIQLEEDTAQKDVLIETMRNEFQNAVNDLDSQIILGRQLQEQLAQAESALHDKTVLVDVIYMQSQEQTEITNARLEELQGLCDRQAEHIQTLAQAQGLDGFSSAPQSLDDIVEEDAETGASPAITTIEIAHPAEAAADSYDAFEHVTNIEHHYETIMVEEAPVDGNAASEIASVAHSTTEPVLTGTADAEHHDEEKLATLKPSDTHETLIEEHVSIDHVKLESDLSTSHPVMNAAVHDGDSAIVAESHEDKVDASSIAEGVKTQPENTIVTDDRSLAHSSSQLTEMHDLVQNGSELVNGDAYQHVGDNVSTHGLATHQFQNNYEDESTTACVLDGLLVDEEQPLLGTADPKSAGLPTCDATAGQPTTSIHDGANAASAAAGCKQQ